MHRIALSLFLVMAVGCTASSDGGTGGEGGVSGSGGNGTGGAKGGSGGNAGSSGGNNNGGRGGSSGNGGSNNGGSGGNGDGGSGVGGSGGNNNGGNGGSGGSGTDASTKDGNTTDGGSTGTDAPPAATGKAILYAAAGLSGGSITSFSFDLNTGKLTRIGNGTSAGSNPDYLALHPTNKFLYVNNEGSNGRVTAMTIGTDGALTTLNSASSGGAGPAAITVHKSGKWLFAANYDSGELGIIAIGTDGKLGTTTSVNAGSEVHYAVDDGVTGNFVFAPCKGEDYVAMYKFDPATGKATPNSPATITVGNDRGPRHMAFNPNGKFAYVSEEGGTGLVAFSYDSTSGLLSAGKELTGLPEDGAHVIVHPSGNFVFHIARGGDAVTVIKVAPDGTISKASSVTPGGYDGTITKDGRFLVVVKGTSVKVYSIDQTTGALTVAGTGTAGSDSQGAAVVVL